MTKWLESPWFWIALVTGVTMAGIGGMIDDGYVAGDAAFVFGVLRYWWWVPLLAIWGIFHVVRIQRAARSPAGEIRRATARIEAGDYERVDRFDD